MRDDTLLDLTKRYSKAFITSGLSYFEEIVIPLLQKYPYWQLAFSQAIGLYGFYMAVKQEEVNEYVEFIKDHPQEFREEIVNSKEFRNGFVIAFQDYLRARTEAKKDVLKKILLGFAAEQDKNEFELERLDEVMIKISSQALTKLVFLKKEILPLKEKTIKEDLKLQNIKNSGKSEEWWFDLNWEREPLSRFIQQWLYDNYDPNSKFVKAQYGVTGDWDKSKIDEVYEISKRKSKEVYRTIDELVHLGVLKLQVSSGGGFSGAAGATYDFSELGYKLLDYFNAT